MQRLQNPRFRRFELITEPPALGTHIFFRFRPKLVDSPKSQLKRILKMQFPKFLASRPAPVLCYIFQKHNLLYFRKKLKTAPESRQIADFEGVGPIQSSPPYPGNIEIVRS